MKQQTIYTSQPAVFFAHLQARNREAVEYSYEKLQLYIANLCKTYPHLRDEVGILATNALMTGFSKIETEEFVYQQGNSPMGFLFKIAQFEVKQAIRSSQNRRFCDLSTVDTDEKTYHFQYEWENRDILANIMRQIPSTHRRIFIWQMKGYSDQEIQEMNKELWRSPDSVKAIRCKDKRKLESLKKYWA